MLLDFIFIYYSLRGLYNIILNSEYLVNVIYDEKEMGKEKEWIMQLVG